MKSTQVVPSPHRGPFPQTSPPSPLPQVSMRHAPPTRTQIPHAELQNTVPSPQCPGIPPVGESAPASPASGLSTALPLSPALASLRDPLHEEGSGFRWRVPRGRARAAVRRAPAPLYPRLPGRRSPRGIDRLSNRESPAPARIARLARRPRRPLGRAPGTTARRPARFRMTQRDAPGTCRARWRTRPPAPT